MSDDANTTNRKPWCFQAWDNFETWRARIDAHRVRAYALLDKIISSPYMAEIAPIEYKDELSQRERLLRELSLFDSYTNPNDQIIQVKYVERAADSYFALIDKMAEDIETHFNRDRQSFYKETALF